MSTSSSWTTTKKCPLSIRYLHPNAMLPRQYPPYRNWSLRMAYQSHSTATMAPNLPAPSSQNLLLTGTSTIAPVLQPTLIVIAKPKQPWKIVKGLLTWSKYSAQNPYLALLAYCSTPVDAHMCSPGEMFYQQPLCTTVPQHIHHTNPHTTADCDCLDQHASLSTANHDHQGFWQKAPLFVRQTVSVLNDARCCGSLPLSSAQQTMDHT